MPTMFEKSGDEKPDVGDFLAEGYFHHMYHDEEFETEHEESFMMGYRSTVPVAGFWMGDFRPDELSWWSGFIWGTATHAPLAYMAADLVTKGWWSARVMSVSPIIDAIGHGMWRTGPFWGFASRVIPAAALFTAVAVGTHLTTSPGATVSHGPYGSVRVVPRLGLIPSFFGV